MPTYCEPCPGKTNATVMDLPYQRTSALPHLGAEQLAAATPRDLEDVPLRPVRVEVRGEDPTVGSGLSADQHGARRVAEQHAGGAVLPVRDAGEQLGADDQDVLRVAALD